MVAKKNLEYSVLVFLYSSFLVLRFLLLLRGQTQLSFSVASVISVVKSSCSCFAVAAETAALQTEKLCRIGIR